MDEEVLTQGLTVGATSQYTADVSDIVIRQGELTRLVLRSELVINQKDPQASVVATLMHQKRHSIKDAWQDADSFNLAHLRSGQEVRLRLSADDTRNLFDALTLQYEIPIGGWYPGQQRQLAVVDAEKSRVVTGREKELIEQLLEEEGEQFWDYIEELRPGLLEATQIRAQHRLRVEALRTFEARLSDGAWAEPDWQSFFETNKWIFGQSLAHQVLIQVESQPVYGGMTLSGRGSQRGDFLMATMANAKFTVLVEIKKPDSNLLGELYRNKTYLIAEELIGGITQIQSNCRTWAIDGSLQAENLAELESSEIYTYQPKGILIVGNTSELVGPHKRASFELFRRELRNPEILTYDELLQRAKVIVAVEKNRVTTR